MTLKEYLDKLPRGGKSSFANKLAVSRSFLSQMADGKAAVSPERAVEIENASNNEVSRKAFFPDRWQRIWPELGGNHE